MISFLRITLPACLSATLALLACLAMPAATSDEQVDKYQWLEEVSSPRSMAWVKAENERSAKILENDPHFAPFESAALQVLQSPERLPHPEMTGDTVYNTWQDATHILGILRRTSRSDYLTAQPHWQTVLDFDALAEKEGQKWVSHGHTCLYPGDEECLVSLSIGGEDANTMREFNLKTGQFVPDGFVLPRSKQDIAWIDKDTLLVARDWGSGTLTPSGYPFVVKLWKRGQPLSQAREVFRGSADDEAVWPETMHDGDGHQVTFIRREVNFFETRYFLVTPTGTQLLPIPPKSELNGLLEDRLLVMLEQDWTPAGASVKIRQGSLVALDLAAFAHDPDHPHVSIVFSPTASEFAQDARVTKSHLLLTTLDKVQGRAYSYTLAPDGTWSHQQLPLPDNRTVAIASTNPADDTFFVSVSGFLTPSSLLFGDASANTLRTAKTLPPQFDASRDIVEQLWATSKDGTKVPYFVVHPKDMLQNSANPVILNAYGGFQISSTPYYSATNGKLWLEHGGVLVLANIRGGGEFGPAWHDAGLKTNRQRIYDDFAAVAQDLFDRHITSPRRLGILGGSNGGLLMGVEMTEHPEMWHAAAIMIPLLDMLRFEKIAAGSSWVAEYGSVAVPEERRFLASISPYNQLKPDVSYPEPYIFTTAKDDRVGPVHARKFAARMEEFHHPFLYQEISEGGHGSGANLKEEARSDAMLYTYFTMKLME